MTRRLLTIWEEVDPREDLVPKWSHVKNPPNKADLDLSIIEHARGWPSLAVWSRVSVSRAATGGHLEVVRDDSSQGDGRLEVRGLLWSGVAINTLFYATILWLPILPFALRRFLRVRRGLCPKCAYPIGESAVCTECGRELPKRVRPAT